MAVKNGNDLTNRRKFLVNGLRTAALFGMANISVYSVGAVFEKLDGSLVAGAKCLGGSKTYSSAAACFSQCGNFCSTKGCTSSLCEPDWAPNYNCSCE